MSKGFSVIGDVHGKFDKYREITESHAFTFQLGDFGFQKTMDAYHYSGVDPAHHKVGQGNHDQHDKLADFPGFIGRYGSFALNEVPFCWVGGGYSIDQVYRVGEWLGDRSRPPTWFSDEELSYAEMEKCKEIYQKTLPSIVISHECPSSTKQYIYGNKTGSVLAKYGLGEAWASMTSQFLDHLFEMHSPKLWIHGHHHTSAQFYVEDTLFVSLGELETYKVDLCLASLLSPTSKASR